MGKGDFENAGGRKTKMKARYTRRRRGVGRGKNYIEPERRNLTKETENQR